MFLHRKPQNEAAGVLLEALLAETNRRIHVSAFDVAINAYAQVSCPKIAQSHAAAPRVFPEGTSVVRSVPNTVHSKEVELEFLIEENRGRHRRGVHIFGM
jgi:hypothetical protein